MSEASNGTYTIHILGKKYEVPAGLTIMKSIEYAGYRLTHGCGCRGGVCGACATIYRMAHLPGLPDQCRRRHASGAAALCAFLPGQL